MNTYEVTVSMTNTKGTTYRVKANHSSTAFREVFNKFTDDYGKLNPTVILGKPKLVEDK